MPHRLLVPELLELLQGERRQDLVAVLTDLHPNDAAEILSGLETEQLRQMLGMLPVELERDLFEYFEPDVQESLLLGRDRQRVKSLLTVMASDDRAELMDQLEPHVRESLLPMLTQAVREDLIRRDRFEDDQVGAILSTEFLVLDEAMTVGEALGEIRRQEPTKETIYYSFVVDGERRLLGFVSLRKLIMAEPADPLSGVINRGVVSVKADDDQEDAARTIREYDLLAIPVVDDQDRLLGILTHDDAADVQEEEAEAAVPTALLKWPVTALPRPTSSSSTPTCWVST